MTAAMAERADTFAEHYAGSGREIHRRALIELARTDPRVFCVDTDTGGLETTFAVEFPERYVNLGIAEANLMGVAAGMASAGLRPYAHTLSGFAAARACEQIKIDIAYNDLPVRIVVTHGGLSSGHYGPTHHAVEDLAILRTLPNLTVVVPADAAEVEQAVLATAGLPGPVVIRLGRAATPLIHDTTPELVPGRAARLRDGTDVTIVATGPWPVLMALQAHVELAALGIRARVLNMHTIKPLDRAAVIAAARETAGLVTVEDHLVIGGLGGAVCEVVTETRPCPVRRIGVPDRFGDEVGDEHDLLVAAGVSPERIVAAAREIVGRAG
ncbi:transketolase family protein [Actinoplanes sp. NPDC051859]|uniref:transketolase family protein n=1 Tax=Actinoplanes sp. NPDC051859 TaxID=3363909 RepID=UPI003796D53C